MESAVKAAAIVFMVGFLTAPVVIEILRSVVHTRRERQFGIGGTQDIAMWGTFAMLGRRCPGRDLLGQLVWAEVIESNSKLRLIGE
jgi:hypothetical protein